MKANAALLSAKRDRASLAPRGQRSDVVSSVLPGQRKGRVRYATDVAAASLLVAVLGACSGSQVPASPLGPEVEGEPIVWLRCEVDWRCYAIDPDKGKRTGLLRSDTAWAEYRADTYSESLVCRRAQRTAEGVRCLEGSPYFEQLEIDRDCSCSRKVEGEE